MTVSCSLSAAAAVLLRTCSYVIGTSRYTHWSVCILTKSFSHTLLFTDETFTFIFTFIKHHHKQTRRPAPRPFSTEAPVWWHFYILCVFINTLLDVRDASNMTVKELVPCFSCVPVWLWVILCNPCSLGWHVWSTTCSFPGCTSWIMQ